MIISEYYFLIYVGCKGKISKAVLQQTIYIFNIKSTYFYTGISILIAVFG